MSKNILVILVLFLTIHSVAAMDYGLRFNARGLSPDRRTHVSLGTHPLEIDREFKIGFNIDFYEAPIVGNIVSIVTDDGQKISVGANEIRDHSYRLFLAVNGRVTYHRKRLVPDPDHEYFVTVTLDRTRNVTLLHMHNSETSQEIDLSMSHDVTVTFGPDDNNGRPYSVPMELSDISFYCNKIHTHHWDFRYQDTDTIVYDEMNGNIAVIRNPDWLMSQHVNWKCIFSRSVRAHVETEFSSHNDMFCLVDDDSIVNFDPIKCRFTSSPNTRGREVARDFINRYPYFDEIAGVRYRIDSDASVVERLDMYTFHTSSNVLTPPILPAGSMSVATVNDRLYIFSQIDSNWSANIGQPCDRYALYEYDTDMCTGRVLWEIISEGYDISPTDHMYYDSDDCFYFASVNNGGCMIRISRSSPEWSIVSTPAFHNACSLDMKVDLYRGFESNRYYLMVDNKMDTTKHQAEIYSISAPFLGSLSDMTATRHVGAGRMGLTWIWIILSVMLLSGIAAAVMVKKRRRHCFPFYTTEEMSDSNKIIIGDMNYNNCSISLLGGFRVRDKNGKDISTCFTTRLKHMLVMLLISDTYDSDGIGYSDIDREIWGDKDERSARNNRNVSMRKLRLLLANVGDVTIKYDKYQYCICSENVKIDYQELMSSLRNHSTLMTIPREELDMMLRLLSAGPLLPDISFGWLERRKVEFTTRTVDMLSERMQAELGHDDNLAYHIAEIITLHTPLHEEALRTKCIILTRCNMIHLAQSVYTSYARDYLLATGHQFTTSLSTLCYNTTT